MAKHLVVELQGNVAGVRCCLAYNRNALELAPKTAAGELC
jgi:hypothetical protein